jgi:arabinose-5-phosphate isomerase
MTSQTNILTRKAADIMTRNPVTIGGSALAAEAIRVMEERKITSLVVVGTGDRVEGVVHLHDLWRTEMI